MKLTGKKIKIGYLKSQVIIEYLIVVGAIIVAIVVGTGVLRIGVKRGLTNLQAGIGKYAQ
ncbi:MAG: hypothetical protein M0R48_03815 [Candidatus Omnitrophica bacterium]|jgi:hypothetical protein|nr:hypothetical protein [Candidatus Omnitrophota bacterium]